MNIGQKIKQLRKERKLEQKELADKIGCTPKAISAWETGRREPRKKWRLKLAEIFGIAEAELYSDDSYLPSEAVLSRKQIKVPLLGEAPAGAKSWVVDEIEDWYEIPRELVKGTKIYLLRVKGDSMIEAGIKDGSLVVVDFEAEIENGDIVVARVNDETTIKKFYRSGKQIILQPANPEYEPQVFTSEDDIDLRGKVVAVWVELK